MLHLCQVQGLDFVRPTRLPLLPRTFGARGRPRQGGLTCKQPAAIQFNTHSLPVKAAAVRDRRTGPSRTNNQHRLPGSSHFNLGSPLDYLPPAWPRDGSRGTSCTRARWHRSSTCRPPGHVRAHEPPAAPQRVNIASRSWSIYWKNGARADAVFPARARLFLVSQDGGGAAMRGCKHQSRSNFLKIRFEDSVYGSCLQLLAPCLRPYAS